MISQTEEQPKLRNHSLLSRRGESSILPGCRSYPHPPPRYQTRRRIQRTFRFFHGATGNTKIPLLHLHSSGSHFPQSHRNDSFSPKAHVCTHQALYNTLHPRYGMQSPPSPGHVRHLYPITIAMDKQCIPWLPLQYSVHGSRTHQGPAYFSQQLTNSHQRIQVNPTTFQ